MINLNLFNGELFTQQYKILNCYFCVLFKIKSRIYYYGFN
ncbi:hypothetical protein L343_0009 [Escherichia coli CE549]|nr:hypothetical protein L343_0009 [Escherichia coli CE549]